MTPSSMIAIRYTGDSRRSEAPITGNGKEWWPGELRCVPLARGSQLLAVGLGWERDEDEDDLVAVTAAQTSAGAVGVAGVTASGGMVGPDGSPVSGGGLAMSIPFVLVASGTVGNNGALSGVPALPRVYSRCWMYFPQGKLYSGSVAGWYYTEMLNTTAGTVYDCRYALGVTPTKTAVSASGPGAFTQLTGFNLLGPQILIPENSLGVGGALIVNALNANSGDSYNKTRTYMLSGNTFASSTDTTGTVVHQQPELRMVDDGWGIGTNYLGFGSATSLAWMQVTIDQTYPLVLQVAMNLAASAQYMTIDHLAVTIIKGN